MFAKEMSSALLRKVIYRSCDGQQQYDSVTISTAIQATKTRRETPPPCIEADTDRAKFVQRHFLSAPQQPRQLLQSTRALYAHLAASIAMSSLAGRVLADRRLLAARVSY
jgi:hypothetical protein